MSCRFKARSLSWVVTAIAVGFATAAWAQDIVFSAKADKTTVRIGDPINLTITLSGDFSGADLPPPAFPPEFAVAARSQSTNFSVRGGVMERSVSFIYVLVPQKVGTFKFGPFTMTRQRKTLKTEPIEITVKKSPLPPNFPSTGERFTL